MKMNDRPTSGFVNVNVSIFGGELFFLSTKLYLFTKNYHIILFHFLTFYMKYEFEDKVWKPLMHSENLNRKLNKCNADLESKII